MVARDQGGFARWPAEPPADVGAHRAVEPATDPGPSGAPAATAPTGRPGRFRAAWRGFRAWRRRRPFWGALLSILGGAEIFYTETAPIRVVVHFGLIGQLGYAVPILIVLCGVLLMFAPQPRAFYASLILLLGLASWLTSNLGGFFVGMLFVVLGGALALSWTTAPKKSRPARTVTADGDATTEVEGG